MTMSNVTMIVEKDKESGWLVGEIVELPGCYTQAPDWPTLESNMREAIQAWSKEHGGLEPESEFVGAVHLDAVP